MSPKKVRKILLIEDEPLIQEIYVRKLEEKGFKVLSVVSAEEAKNILRKEKFHLIILDILLPKEDGVSFLAKIRKQGNKTPVIILSNLEDDNYRKKAKKLKVKDYLIKTNYTPAELVELIQKYL
ncbi:response regulator [bacterium]|nr:response regulator [bacterium]